MQQSRTNWAGNVAYRAAARIAPRSTDELQAVVGAHPQVTALGSGHSFNRVADTDGVQVTLAEMPPFVEVDSDRRVARVAAGMTYTRIASRLDSDGWALANMASLPHISVGGAVATGTHGSGVGNPSLAQAVVGLELVRADGAFETVGVDDPRLNAHRVALGALGVVVAVHLAIEPRYEVAQTVHTGVSWDVLDDQFERIMSAAYSVSLFTAYADDGIRQVWTKWRTDRHGPLADLTTLGAVAATSQMHPVSGADPAAVTEQLGRPGSWAERLAHFRSSFEPSAGEEIQCEYLLPASDAVGAIHALRRIGGALAPVLFVSEIRRIAADDAWLAPSSERDSVAFHFTFHRDAEGVAAVLPLIDGAFAPFDARPHWGKVTSMPVDRLHEVYPRLDAFAALAHDLDPDGRFRNPYLRDVLG